MISTENIFLKNDFPETILRRKPFYAETNGALVILVSQFDENIKKPLPAASPF
jgi:hypothetical protein